MIALITTVHIVENFLTSVVLDIDIDVRCLGIFATRSRDSRFGKESFEQKAMQNGIYCRDAEAVCDCGIGSAAAALAEDILPARKANSIPHHKKETGEAQSVDDCQFVLDLGALFAAQCCTPAHVRTFVYLHTKVFFRTGARGDRECWQRWPEPAHGKVAFRRYAFALLDSIFQPLPHLEHFFGRTEAPLTVGMQQAALRRTIEIETGTQGCEHVVNQSAVVVQITRIVAHDPRCFRTSCQIHQRPSQRTLVTTTAMALHFHRDSPAERFAPFVKCSLGVIPFALAQELGDGAGCWTGEQMQSFRTFRYVRPWHTGHSALALSVAGRPASEQPDPRAREERREIATAMNIPCQQCHRPSIDSQFCSCDQPNSALVSFDPGAHHAAQIRCVSDAYRVVAKTCGTFDEGLGRHGAVAKGECCVGTQLDVWHQSHQPCRYHTPLRASRYNQTRPPLSRTQRKYSRA